MPNPSRDPRQLADARAAGPLAIFNNLADLRRAFAHVPMAAAVLDEHRDEVMALFDGVAGR